MGNHCAINALREEIKIMVIRKLPSKRAWRLYSRSSGKILGTFTSKKKARKREGQIRFFMSRRS